MRQATSAGSGTTRTSRPESVDSTRATVSADGPTTHTGPAPSSPLTSSISSFTTAIHAEPASIPVSGAASVPALALAPALASAPAPRSSTPVLGANAQAMISDVPCGPGRTATAVVVVSAHSTTIHAPELVGAGTASAIGRVSTSFADRRAAAPSTPRRVRPQCDGWRIVITSTNPSRSETFLTARAITDASASTVGRTCCAESTNSSSIASTHSRSSSSADASTPVAVPTHTVSTPR